MPVDRIVAVGLLTATDIDVLGQGFRRLFPVPPSGDFGELLRALDTVELAAAPMPDPMLADAPSKVAVEDGRVLVEGPGGIVITFTPDAARETGRRLSRAGEEAAG